MKPITIFFRSLTRPILFMPLFLSLLGGAVFATAVRAATFTVTKTADTNDGVCNSDCSLREAISAANASPGADTINLPAGTYTLTLANAGGTNEDNNATGDLDVLDSVTIQGAGAGTTIIQAGTSTSNGIDKVFALNPICTSAINVTIDGVTIRFGRNTQPSGAADFSFTGGGIDWCSAGAGGTFTLSNSVVSDNTNVNGYGGGLNVDTVSSPTTVNITNVTFSNNQTLSTTQTANGGAINLFGDSPTINITNSTFTGNHTTNPTSGGGAIYFRPTTVGHLTISGSTFTTNTAAGIGGAIATDSHGASSTISIQNSTFTGNTATNSFGGALNLDGTNLNTTPFALSHLTITGNTAGISGGGIFVGNSNVTMSKSLIVGNNAPTGKGLHKSVDAATATVTNNWWGCSTGPGAAPCDTATTAGGTLTFSPWYRDQLTAATFPLVTNQSTALSASFLTNSANAAVPVADLAEIIGRSVAWSATHGDLSSTQGTVQAAGTATGSFQATSAGTAIISAKVDNDNTSPVSSNVLSLTVNKADTTTAITSDTPDPTVTGQPYTVNYSVSAAFGVSPTAPTGNVVVSDGTDTCTGTVAAGQCTFTSFTIGSKTLTATYQGDSNFNASPASAGVAHTVNKADTTTAITSDSPDPSVVGQSVTVQYSVTVNAPGGGTPTGNVTVSDGTISCTATVAAGQCSLVFTSTGAKNLTATYVGDANYNGSTSATEPHTVNKADTTTTITSDNPDPSSVGQAVTVQYNVVVNAPGAGTPTGNVTVSDGTISCTATVAAGQCSLTFTSAGTKSLTATYVGDSNFNGSTSAAEPHNVSPPATLSQCANDPSPSPSSDGCDTSANQWPNGNLGAGDAVYFEGESVPYRVVFNGLSLASHTVTIEWDTTSNSAHAIDYLTSFDRTVTTANPCLGISGCSLGSYTTFAIPADPNIPFTQIAGNLTLFGGTITSVSAYSYTGGTDNPVRITITFTASQANPVLAWGGHIASRADWGASNSAVAIAGSPYQMSLIDVDGGTVGNQDIAVSSDAVIFPGSITIIKDATPNGSTSFSFTASPSPLTIFSLVDDGTSANTKAFTNITTFQTYTINETPVPAGWNFNSVSCSVTSPNGGSYTSSSTTVNISMEEGENWTCTYANSRPVIPGSITIIKDANPNGSTPFSFTASPSPLTIFSLVDDGTSANTIVFANITAFQTYTINETPVPAGWNFNSVSCSVTSPNGGSYSTSSTTVNINLQEGENWTCTYLDSLSVGTLTVIKHVVNDNGGTATSNQWSIHVKSGGSEVTGSPQQGSESGTSYTLVGGTYTVSETGGASGYTFTGFSGNCDSGGNVTVVAGQTKTCTLTNDDQTAHLKLVKVVINDNGGTAATTDFTVSAAGPTPISGAGGAESDVNPGTYTLSETSLPGYTASVWTCVGGTQNGSQITLAAGESATCTITNDDQPGTIIINKVTVPGSSQSFSFQTTGTGYTNFSLSDGQSNSQTLSAGSYTVKELVPLGWKLTGIGGSTNPNTPYNCTVTGSNGSTGVGDLSTQTATISLKNGDTATCTFTNERVGIVTDASLCTFDVDSLLGDQFKLILTPDPNKQTTWKLNASNPGQFSYNTFYFGTGNTTINVTLPFPFVTQGAVPIHVYDNVTIESANGQICFTPGAELANSSTQVVLSDYSPQTFGSAVIVPFSIPSLTGGFAYINIHLYYGLKGTAGWTKGGSNEAISTLAPPLPKILNGQSYVFSDDVGGSDTVFSENSFKRDPGIGGLVTERGSTDPVANIKVEIYDSKKLLATVYTDQDGWYMWQYKYTGKAATFTVKLPDYNLSQPVTLKSNGFLVVNFTLP